MSGEEKKYGYQPTPAVPYGEEWSVGKALDQLEQRPEESKASPVEYLHFLERLKTTKREGWLYHGIKEYLPLTYTNTNLLQQRRVYS